MEAIGVRTVLEHQLVFEAYYYRQAGFLVHGKIYLVLTSSQVSNWSF